MANIQPGWKPFLACCSGPPDYIRKAHGRARTAATQAKNRLALARDGYALVRCELAVFKPET
jgi:hypothetical protein